MGARERLRLLRRKALYGWKETSESYVAHLRSVGIEVGDGCEVFSPEVTHVDTTVPHLLAIGSRVAMTGPVTILCHGYSVGVTKVWSHGDVLGSQRRTRVGDNVFLAYGCTVLAGTEIGDDVVIGAGALATGKLRAWHICATAATTPRSRRSMSSPATRGNTDWTLYHTNCMRIAR